MTQSNFNGDHRSDFTLARYRKLLHLAKKSYRFINFEEYKTHDRSILWRHDIDFSVHRAVRLAAIEKELGITSTFFIHLHSPFYNWQEAEISSIFEKIKTMGHRLALHFDPNYYGSRITDVKDLTHWLNWEKCLLETEFGIEVKTFSFHNPTVGFDCLNLADDVLAGMINTYGPTLKNQYEYCSDSNGYWRHKNLFDVLEDNTINRLQVLTHPVWWQKEVMSPRDRIKRSIDSRAVNNLRNYDSDLKSYNRENIK